ncbi:MAG: tRNA pseudouridine(55) synthase TruB [Planctomycetota bacterium]|nr:tRNA pseudouridine(55) synthase TruB [Planctomycetota bacterium]
MFGFLNIRKPADVTSRDVVNKIQRLIKSVKVGHAGTLDPLATGVLVLAVGKATRLMEHIHALPKSYLGTFKLGFTSDTEDIQGEMQPIVDAPVPSRERLEKVIAGFAGVQSQQPPIYSALKIKGRRAYDLARKGRDVQLKPREIKIHRIVLMEYAYPYFELEVQCSSGTYMRSLGRDIGKQLQSGAVMSALERQAIGEVRIQQSHSPDFAATSDVEDALLDPLEVLTDPLPICLTDEQCAELSFGRSIDIACDLVSDEMFATDPQGRFIAILQPVEIQHDKQAATQRIRPIRYFG